jgi:two-component system, OmpR family, response regulator ChvI
MQHAEGKGLVQQGEHSLASRDRPAAGAAASGRRVLVIDDDDSVRETLQLNLADEGFTVSGCSGGLEALRLLAAGALSPDVILLDWHLADMNGLDVLRALRQRGISVPVIVLTADAALAFEEAAFADGAVDFIDKSRGLSIVAKRIQLVAGTERTSGAPAQADCATPASAPLELRFEAKRVLWRERAVSLTPSERRVVARLVAKPGEDVPYAELWGAMGGGRRPASSRAAGRLASLRATIKHIRRKFRDVDPDFERISSYPKFGYRWLFDEEQ